MKPLPGSLRTPIGLDVGARGIKAAQLRRSGRGWRAEALTMFPRERPDAPVDRAEAERLSRVLPRQGFVGKCVVLAVPDQKLLTGILDLPPSSSGAPLDKIARIELSRVHRQEPDAFEMAYWQLPASPQVKDSTQAMAVACPHADANEFLDVFEQAGLDVAALDVRTCAVARACEPMLAPTPAITAVLDVGWNASVLLLLYKDTVVYDRVLAEAGLKSASQAVGKKLRLDDDVVNHLLVEIGLAPDPEIQGPQRQVVGDVTKALVKHCDGLIGELDAPFAYALHQYPPEGVKRMLLIGGGPSISGLAEHLAERLDMEVFAVSPVNLADCPQHLTARAGSAALTVAVGLAQFGGGRQ